MRRERREKPIKNRKRADIEIRRGVSPVRDQAPTTFSDEDDNSEKRGGFEAELEQPVLSPVADHGYQLS